MRKFFNRMKSGPDSPSPAAGSNHSPSSASSTSVRDRVNLFEPPSTHIADRSGLGLQMPDDNSNVLSQSLNRRKSNLKHKSQTHHPPVTSLDLATSVPNDIKDKRQVAFVSPPNTSVSLESDQRNLCTLYFFSNTFDLYFTVCLPHRLRIHEADSTILSHVDPLSPCVLTFRHALATIIAATTRPPSPPAPIPSLPSHRPATGTSGPSSGRATHATNNPSFHHPPSSMTSPLRNWRPDGLGGPGSYSSSQHGYLPSFTSPGSANDHGNDRGSGSLAESRAISPLSFMSYSQSGRRSSGGMTIGPAQTWGGNLIGGRMGEDIFQPMTWSEMTDMDLVENLSGRERTRQEVLWEIVASEERYVSELVSLRNNYISPLLHPLISPVMNSPPPPSSRVTSPFCQSPIPSSTANSSCPTITSPPNINSDTLPIAARFLRSPSPHSNMTMSNQSGDNIPDMESEDFHQPSQTSMTLPDRSGEQKNGKKSAQTTTRRMSETQIGGSRTKKNSFPDYSSGQPQTYDGLNHPNRSSSSINQPKTNSNSTLKGLRHYLKPPITSNKLHKIHSQTLNGNGTEASYEFLLPESLRIVFNIIDEGMFRGHEDLSVQLKTKYLEQFPLVRDLTSVWAEQSWIIQIYSIYVMHLERALRDVEEALAAAGPKASGMTKSQKRFAKLIMQLEENAAKQGECGLAICLSKPFQRLLKYPLLFQNLLYHTDASTHEYESAHAMAISIDSIVRSIEDEKISEEERDKARDAWSRIEGMNEKVLMVPKSDRLLMSEESVWKPVPGKEKRTLSDAAEGSRSNTPTPTASEAHSSQISMSKKDHKSTADRLRILKGQKSFRRLSDMIGSEAKEPTMGSKRDVWLVVFSDVILRCQRVGVTRMSTNTFSSAAKDKKKTRRSLPGRERNLYKFIKIERWEKHPSIVLGEANKRLEDEKTPTKESFPESVQSKPQLRVQIQSPDGDDELETIQRSGTGEYERMRRESEMSFSYDLDDPRPVASNVLKPMTNTMKASQPTASSVGFSKPTPPARVLSPTTQSVINKKTNAVSKFSNRVPTGNPTSASTSGSLSGCASPPSQRPTAGHSSAYGPSTTLPLASQYRYETPTTSTLAKKMQAGSNALQYSTNRAQSPPPVSRPPTTTRRRAGSTSGQNPIGANVNNNASRRRSGSTGPPSPPMSKSVNHKARTRNSATALVSNHKRNFVNHADHQDPRVHHQTVLQSGMTISKQPSEDFSAFESYFDSSNPLNHHHHHNNNNQNPSRALAFPSS
ncbi:hypothetical protein DFH28DRAFT_1117269 [Melampsora americana]|nr:hypothetical protein DFH28DRAFT_1117269 [Melampsora americana]